MQPVMKEAPALPDINVPCAASSWRDSAARFQTPNLWRSWWQILTGPVAYVVMCCLAYISLGISVWLAAGMMLIAAGFSVRMFIVFHDCTHGSFFRSRRANEIVGFVTGVLSFTPFQHWRRQHKIHHATAGDLDRRGVGDIWTLTVAEYRNASRWTRLGYRIFRNPVVMLLVGPSVIFLVRHRFSSKGVGRRERRSVAWTNVALLGIVALMSAIVGLKGYLLVQLPIFVMAGAAGVWLFYVQHDFEDTWWQNREKWDFERQALEGSSFYKLPLVLQWFSGNIGFHHVHHLNPRIPNYHLPRCHRENEIFQSVKPLRFWASLRCAGLSLWDEEARKLVPFSHLRSIGRGLAA